MKRQKVIELDRVETPSKSFNIDWDNVLVPDEEVPDLEIVEKTPPQEPTFSSGEDSAVCVKSLKDSELDDHLKRQRSLLTSFGDKLPDKGARIRDRIGNLEYEKQRRFFLPAKSDTDECRILVQPKSSDVFKEANTAATGSKEVSQSTFAANFSVNLKVDARPVKLFNEDLGRESWKSKGGGGGETATKQSNGWRSMPRLGKCRIAETNFYSGFKEPKRSHEASVNRKRKKESSSPYLLVDDDDDDEDDVVGYDTPREWSTKATLSQRSSSRKKSDDKVINLDEEEPEAPMVVEEALELPQGLPEDICYPSRDDPDVVQVSLKDLKCLSPGEYLTSPVINFYIRFLQHQVFAANQTAADCHFFNTFFYKKLIEAVSYKGNDKEAFFVKLRRWWKGFDLFRKSYIFIPIHEDLHWSLVIICIPDKEDESGLTILHLDSLGLHPTKSIFNNVRRFLIEEWSYLNQDASLPEPISEKIWRDLPHRINEAEVKVPQQMNDFDCGLFVLFFIQRFIEDAPQRLKLHDLGMIHKKWFKPSEASALRIKIWNKLIELFRESNHQTY